ncbi:ANTAR domain-containing protein [Streptomyces sp. NPDC048663]|uniref:ANTAR domain-containing protein n=1 Tax=Streptomyces sp. NPDC048663 TaxID=3155638 RepID=UPI00342C8287
MEYSGNGRPVPRDMPGLVRQAEVARQIAQLKEEIDQLQEAIASHAVIDQAIGVVISLGKLCPEQGFEVLRTVSQHTNTKLRKVAALIVNWPGGGPLPDAVHQALEQALTEVGSS